MNQIVVKALEISETETIIPVLQQLRKSNNIHILVGAQYVGKTAFVLKLMQGCEQFPSLELRPKMIHLEEMSTHWYNRANPSLLSKFECVPFVGDKAKEALAVTVLIHYKWAIEVDGCNLIVVDGLDRFFSKRDDWSLAERFVTTAKPLIDANRKLNFLFTVRHKNFGKLFQLLKTGDWYPGARMPFKFMTLVRPAFLNEQCTEFGNYEFVY